MWQKHCNTGRENYLNMYKKENYNKGKSGEEMAKDLLLQKGYKLVEMNYENKIGEIDLIMTDKDFLVFVEVKLKIGDKFGIPEDMIDKRKLWQIKKVSESYLVLENKKINKFKKYRIDAVCVVLNENKETERITHYENI